MAYLRKRSHPLVDLRENAFDESKKAHNRIRKELALFKNEEYTDSGTWIDRLKRGVKRSLSPQSRAAVHRLVPVFTESMTNLNITPARKDANEIEWDAAQELEDHLKTTETIDGESEHLKDSVLHNQALGNCVSKIYWDCLLYTSPSPRDS